MMCVRVQDKRRMGFRGFQLQTQWLKECNEDRRLSGEEGE